MTQTKYETPRRLTDAEIAELPPVAWATELNAIDRENIGWDAGYALETWPEVDGQKPFVAVEAQNAREGLDQHIVLITVQTDQELVELLATPRRIYTIAVRYV